jgi:hypothetical protein
MANAPLNGDGMARDVVLICPTGEAKYFFRKGWTSNFVGRSLICPSGKSRANLPLAIQVPSTEAISRAGRYVRFAPKPEVADLVCVTSR